MIFLPRGLIIWQNIQVLIVQVFRWLILISDWQLFRCQAAYDVNVLVNCLPAFISCLCTKSINLIHFRPIDSPLFLLENPRIYIIIKQHTVTRVFYLTFKPLNVKPVNVACECLLFKWNNKIHILHVAYCKYIRLSVLLFLQTTYLCLWLVNMCDKLDFIKKCETTSRMNDWAMLITVHQSEAN